MQMHLSGDVSERHLQILTAASWQDSMSRGKKNGKILNFEH